MNQYELLYIVSSKYTDAEVETIMDKVSAMMVKHGATILRNEMIGKLRLAYPIKGQRNGSYVLVHFDMEAQAAPQAEHDLRLADEVLRHLLLERTAQAQTRRYVLESYQSPLTDEGHRRRDERRVVQTRPAAATAVAEPSMSMEELDKKLDEILEDKTLDNV